MVRNKSRTHYKQKNDTVFRMRFAIPFKRRTQSFFNNILIALGKILISYKETRLHIYMEIMAGYMEKSLTPSERPIFFCLLGGPGLAFLFLIGAREPSGMSPAAFGEDQSTQHVFTASENSFTSSVASPLENDISGPHVIEKPYYLKKGETFVGLLIRAGITSPNAHQWAIDLADHIQMRRLKAGDRFDVVIKDRKILTLRHRISFSERVIGTQSRGNTVIRRENVPLLSLFRYTEGPIQNSLYLAASTKSVSDRIINEMIDILAFDVDFQREIRKGDIFEVYYEQYYSPEYGDTQDGRILYVNLTPNGRPVTAFWHSTGTKGDYFTEKGVSIRKALMKTPVDGARLSGTFGKRKHPVLGYTRLHKGLDFAAPAGTPIKAAGDGVIDFIGRKGGYGNFIRIQHGSAYQTGYAHLSKFTVGLKKGSSVQQGNIIGTVGSTGLATGPHLHYEVMKNGVHVDPRKLKLPEAKRLSGQDLNDFKTSLIKLRSDINLIKTENVMP